MRQHPASTRGPVLPHPQLFTAEVSPQTSPMCPWQVSSAPCRARLAGVSGVTQPAEQAELSKGSLLLLAEEGLHALHGPCWGHVQLPVHGDCPYWSLWLVCLAS